MSDMSKTRVGGDPDDSYENDEVDDFDDTTGDVGSYVGADAHVRRTLPQRAAAGMSRAQWESATSSMRALSVGGQELVDEDEADVAAALASLDMPPAESPSMPIPMQEPRTTMLNRNAEPRTTMLARDGAPEPRTTMLDRGARGPAQTGPAPARTTYAPRPMQADYATQPSQTSYASQAANPGSTAPSPPTVRREVVASRPYEDTAYVNAPRGVAYDERYADAGRVSGGAAVAAGLLSFFAILLRLLAIALIVLVIVNAIPIGLGNFRVHIVNITGWFDNFIPQALSGRLAIQTVFGGTFRGDLALCSIGLFVIDWLLSRLSAWLKRGR